MASREIVLTFDPRSVVQRVLSEHYPWMLRKRPTWQFGPDAAEHPVPCRWPEESCRGHVPQDYAQAVHNPVSFPVSGECPHIWRDGEAGMFCVRCTWPR